jgi:DNA-binding transcriptional LysR family regulator
MRSIDGIGRRVRLNDLQVFLAVAEAGSMGKAAERLHTSQSAVSRTITQLEHTFGVRLLDRSTRGVDPTQYGRALLQCGTEVFDDLRQGIRNIEFLSDPTAGELRIGTTEPLSVGLVADAISRLSRQHPRIVFHVTLGDAASLYRELQERKIDIVVARTLAITDEDIKAEVLFEDTYSVAAGAQNRWTSRRRISLADLIDEPWILPPVDSLIGSVAASAFALAGLDLPATTVFSHSVHLRSRLIATGPFLTLFPGAMLKYSPRHAGYKVLPVKVAVPPWPVAAATLRTGHLAPSPDSSSTARASW